MKIVYHLCLWSYVVTVILYTTIIWGLYAQAFLGIIHVLAALYCYIRYKKLDYFMKKRLNRYAIAVGVYFTIPFMESVFDLDVPLEFAGLRLAYLTIVPMSIGLYFVYIMHEMRNLDKRTAIESGSASKEGSSKKI